MGFESIHPFEDGNGRAILDMALAQGAQLPYRLHGISTEMRRQQSAYYDALDAAQRDDGDVSEWLSWFVDAFVTACQASATLIDESLVRARFWSEHRAVELNTQTPAARRTTTGQSPDGRGRPTADGDAPRSQSTLGDFATHPSRCGFCYAWRRTTAARRTICRFPPTQRLH